MLMKQLELGHFTLPEEPQVLEEETTSCSAAAQAATESQLRQIERLIQRGSGEAIEGEEAASISKDRLQEISRSVWRSMNPGYVERACHFQSVSHSEYAWKEGDVQQMKKQGELESTHHRKRDEFTRYVEAAARSTNLQRSQTPGQN
ncbi:hypothetical protein N2152v2_005902 [Parachlorella kessleri]